MHMSYLLSVDVAIRKGQWRVVFVHGLARETADEVRLRAVRERQRVGEIVERIGADRTLSAEVFRLVALPAWSLWHCQYHYNMTSLSPT